MGSSRIIQKTLILVPKWPHLPLPQVIVCSMRDYVSGSPLTGQRGEASKEKATGLHIKPYAENHKWSVPKFPPSWIKKGEKPWRWVDRRDLGAALTFFPSLAAPLVDLTPSHSGSAMLMLLSVVFVGLAVFVIYKFKRYDAHWAVSFSPLLPFTEVFGFCFAGFSFLQWLVSWFVIADAPSSARVPHNDGFCWCFRKIPGLNRYAQMQNEKDQEMVSPVSQRESIPNVPQSELMSPQQLVDEKLEAQPIGK